MKRILTFGLMLAMLIVGVFVVAITCTPDISATDLDRQWYQEQAEARTAQSVETIVAAGLTASYTAIPTDGVYFSNDGQTFLHVKNSSGGTLTVTVQTQLTVDGLAVADLSVAIAGSEEKFIGPFPTTTYNVQSGAYANTCYVDPSSYDAALTMAILTF